MGEVCVVGLMLSFLSFWRVFSKSPTLSNLPANSSSKWMTPSLSRSNFVQRKLISFSDKAGLSVLADDNDDGSSTVFASNKDLNSSKLSVPVWERSYLSKMSFSNNSWYSFVYFVRFCFGPPARLPYAIPSTLSCTVIEATVRLDNQEGEEELVGSGGVSLRREKIHKSFFETVGTRATRLHYAIPHQTPQLGW